MGNAMEIELLAPAGDMTSAKAAINAGADAVYAGGEFFGARAYAENFTTESLIELIDYAHIHGRKIYLTVNTLLKDAEIKNSLYDFIKPLYKEGLDAVIVQDIGAIIFLRENFPEIDIHASTQMTVTGVETVRMLEKMGVCRVILPRELSLEEIRNIHASTNAEIETFVHGALCYCYSGQCLLSSFIGGRSGNRGRCAGPCRMTYDAIRNGKYLNSKNEKYLLSPKDLCVLNILPEIVNAGVTSLKIEGRMKKPEYIAGVVSIYRKYLDMLLRSGKENYAVDASDIDKLSDLFNRNGFTEGYYKNHNGRKMISLTEPAFRTENEELISKIRKKYINDSIKENINFKLTLSKYFPAKITAVCRSVSVEAEGNIAEPAQKRPLRRDDVLRQLSRLGDSPYRASEIQIEMDDGIFVPVSELNRLRRNAVNKLSDAITAQYKRHETENDSMPDYKETKNNQGNLVGISEYDKEGSKPVLNCLISRAEQLDASENRNFIDTIYVEWSILNKDNIFNMAERIHKNNKKFYVALPHVCRDSALSFFNNNNWFFNNMADGYLARSIEEYYYIRNKSDKPIVFDYNIYSFNSISKKLLNDAGCEYTTVPMELNCKELQMRGCENEEMVIYGKIPVMVSAGCVKKTTGNCDHVSETVGLKDRIGEMFSCRNECSLCYNVIYNSKPLSLLNKSMEVLSLGLRAFRLEFTDENPKETSDILDKFTDVYYLEKQRNELPEFTRGHFTRGVK